MRRWDEVERYIWISIEMVQWWAVRSVTLTDLESSRPESSNRLGARTQNFHLILMQACPWPRHPLGCYWPTSRLYWLDNSISPEQDAHRAVHALNQAVARCWEGYLPRLPQFNWTDWTNGAYPLLLPSTQAQYLWQKSAFWQVALLA